MSYYHRSDIAYGVGKDELPTTDQTLLMVSVRSGVGYHHRSDIAYGVGKGELPPQIRHCL